MKTIIFVFFFSFGLFCCSSPKTTYSEEPEPEAKPVVLDLAGSIGKNVPDTFLWNSIAKKVTYIPLQTNSQSLFSSSMALSYMEDFILIEDHRFSKLFMFDKAGNFLRSPVKQGGGPGEILYMTSTGYNPADSTIQVFDNSIKKIYYYNINGTFLYERELTESVRKVNFSNPDYLICYLSPDQINRIAICDRENLTFRDFYLEKDTTLPRKENMFLIMLSERSKVISPVCFYNLLNSDTVYVLNKGEFSHFLLEKGKYSMPTHLLADMRDQEMQSYLMGFELTQFRDYYYISYFLKGINYTDLWSKKDHAVLSRATDDGSDSPQRGFRYKLKDGSYITMAPSIIEENKIGFLVPAYNLLDEIPGLKEDDNPVVVMMEI